MNVLLDVWREACRHTDLSQALERIGDAVADELPGDFLALRRLDLERAQLDTVAIAAIGSAAGALPQPARTHCTPDQLRELLEWARTGRLISSVREPRHPLLRLLSLTDGLGETIAGPLSTAQGPIGALVVTARPPRRLPDTSLPFILDLLEPISIAMANEQRLHELLRLREALEADRQALLQRLDRQDVADAIVGSDSGLKEVMERVTQVAPTDAPVLLLGETGTGKEVVARAIHSRSRRATGPVVRVNCGALPPGLLDSELFGHERGSFTGAIATRKGWFERADGGTLFLDEVGELPPDAQVRLLRILQDGTFERVGGHRSISVDVRLVTATNQDLHAMVANGTFREDLWYRVGVFPIRLPPLRERPEDIPALATHFASRAGKRLGGSPLSLAPDDVEILLDYAWPGNVRELAAVIERAAILGDGKHLRLAAALGGATLTGDAKPRRDSSRPRDIGDADLGLSLDQAMARHIERALEACGGQIEGGRGAAKRLGINPHTLRARMRKLRIEWSRYREKSGGENGE